jgi:RimJ/RimL family protein N-acetyltransferase
MTKIETDRLNLRPWSISDFEALSEFYEDNSNAKYVGGVKNNDDAWRALATHIGHWELTGFGYWAVDEKSSGDFVGCVGLWKSIGWPELELGYWLMPEHQGKGFALEAAQRCRSYAKNVLEAESLVSYIDSANKPSIKLAVKMGASYETTIELLEHGPHQVYRHF